MKRILILMSIALVGAATGVGGASWAHNRRERAEKELAEIAAKKDDLRASNARLERAAAEARSLAATPVDAPAAAVAAVPEQKIAPKSTTGASAVPKPGTPEFFEARNRAMLEHPELLALYKKQLRAGIEQNYRPFYRQLRLTPEQAKQFVELKLQRDDAQEDFFRAAREKKLAPDDPALNPLRTEIEEEHKAAMKELLGSSGYAEMRKFERAQPARQIVTEAASLVAYTANPITYEQIDQLTRIFAESSQTYRQGGRATGESMDWDAIVTRAAAILPEPQLAAIRAEAQRRRVVNLVAQFYAQRGFKY